MSNKQTERLSLRCSKHAYQARTGGDTVTEEFLKKLKRLLDEYPEDTTEPALILLLNRKLCKCSKEAV